MRRTIYYLAASISGLLVAASYLVRAFWLDQASAILQEGALILLGFAGIALAARAATMVQRRIQHNPAARWYGGLAIAAFAVTLVVVLADGSGTYSGLIGNAILLPGLGALAAVAFFYLVQWGLQLIGLRLASAALLALGTIAALLLANPLLAAYWPAAETVRIWLIEVPLAAVLRAVLLGMVIWGIPQGVRSAIVALAPRPSDQEQP
ncbi:MAG: hypothetical protein GXY52_04430 [Chloroflexi bacterium]|nr:hypothetical protein [Chloroflexota bacterium]